MRKHYLDNIRIISILLLFFYHTFMIWNNYGDKFYIWGGNNKTLSSLIILVSPYLMPLLFVIAGISARFSLNKRNTKEFIKERINKLLIPFIGGIILLVPFQTLYARKFFYNYKGSVIDNFAYFFTHFSDLNGYDGMFTFGHLWFLFYLFVITLICLLIFKKIPFNKVSKKISNINIIGIILLFILIFISYHIGNFGGKSIGKFTLLYLFGYYLFTDEFINKLIHNKKIIIPLFLISEITLVILYYNYSYYDDLFVNFTCWLGVLSSIIIGKLYINKENKITNYLRVSSFPIYILHQTILVIVGYYCLTLLDNILLEVIITIFGSFILTLLLYEIIKRIPILKKVIGA